MYRQLKPTYEGQKSFNVKRLLDNSFIPFDPANTDYAKFKKEINEETSQLQDADGNVMTTEEAKAFIATLP